ncbi:MAG: sigma-70 family RNA polymerase sigma factor [Planctomycetota bacterium]
MTADDGPGGSDASSEDLFAASQSGDGAALESLVVRHYPMLRAYLRLNTGPGVRHRESVSDLAQSVCREVLRNADRFEYMGERAFRAWLCEAALMKIKNKHAYHNADMRDARREVEGEDGIPNAGELAAVYSSASGPEARAIEAEMVQRVEAEMDCLAEDARRIVSLRIATGMTHREIAAHVGYSEAAVRKAFGRALAQLSVRLGPLFRDGE